MHDTETAPPAGLPHRSAPLVERFATFLDQHFPFATPRARATLELLLEDDPGSGPDAAQLDTLRPRLRDALRQRLAGKGLPEHAVSALVDACDGFLHRAAIAASLTADERRELLWGMVLTRAVDNRLKAFFGGGEVRWGNRAFQGKGFRSLGQEAIYAAPLRLRRGERWRRDDGSWGGDVIAPMIRDLGAALAMYTDPSATAGAVRAVLNAQMGKAGPPMDGKDLHLGDFAHGVLPPAAPLSISSANVAGLALAFRQQDGVPRDGDAGDGDDRPGGRVAVSFIGEGGTSLGEWHEAINICAARRLPAVFCVQNNQTALSTPVPEQSAVRTFADKAAGYGMPGITLDGTDPDAIAAAFAWAAERARAGRGPALVELVAMRMCGHAHHDDMLYLGRDPQPAWDYPELAPGGYADPDLYARWSARDPLPTYAARLRDEGVIGDGDFAAMKRRAEELAAEQAEAVIAAPWPEPRQAGEGVYASGPAVRHREPLEDRPPPRIERFPPLPAVDAGLPFDRDGRTFLEAVMLGVGDALRADPRVFVYGEDVGGSYGNAFLLLRPLLEEFGGRILNAPIAEAGILGVCTGAALAGQRPIGEIQFNDFVATGFNQLVNNAAKTHYRWGHGVPMVVRMPWGGLRHAGPYHSQNTEPWFYRTPGLKIVCPSTPQDARALMAAAVADPDPVLYYEHIALYREPRIKQALPDAAPEPLPLGRAALRRAGDDLGIVTYGAYVHVALRVAEALAADGIGAAVLDLRSLAPLDREAVLAVARHCSRVLICHEDSRTGGIGESLAAVVQEEAFEYLDAPVRVVGALDTPVPYSPPLEAEFLAGEEGVERAARALLTY